jgi:hypothetical protein
VTPRMRSACALAVVMAVVAADGCTKEMQLPVAPSELATGIVVFEHANYLGNSAHLTGDIPDLRKFKGPCVHESDDSVERDWNDCISSVRVAPGWRATVYRGTNYRDDAFDIIEDVPNLQLIRQHDCPKGGLNDCVSSVRVRRFP